MNEYNNIVHFYLYCILIFYPTSFVLSLSCIALDIVIL